MITGDRQLLVQGTEANRRLHLQVAQVGELKAVFWGRGALVSPLFTRGRFDIVTAQDPFWRGLAAWIIARRLNAKLQLQIHTNFLEPSFGQRSFGNRLRARLGKFLLRRADCVRVVSEPIARSLAPFHLSVPVSMLPVFIDIDEVRTAPAADLRAEYPQFSKILLVTARLEQEKNIDAIIREMPDILKVFPEAGLFIAGSGTQREILVKLAGTLGVANNVVFLGFRTDIFSLYKAADVVLAATATYEGYGASTVEALAAGCPVISDDVGIARQAGASIAPRGHYADAAIGVLRSGVRGELKLSLPDRDTWAKKWGESLRYCAS